ncbi:MAG: hypothetical protein LBF58_06735 [Deltaproteobacteria bacterium]|jgi:hypothetical protein|nr:hypothetical protein [Deltaproteobacteria bacterium]
MAMKSPPAPVDLDDRLECYGCFNPQDYVCSEYCALSLNCAVANKHFLDGQVKEEFFLAPS